ncbi:hypothetical protein [Synechocystis sp. LKSZ1]|uniref:hypothetical protein n=1 Tax=Synechocystis sp. LKSZ1 TaxID=3144951 RepID=UPI00336C1BF3
MSNPSDSETKIPQVEVDFDPASVPTLTEKLGQLQRQFQQWFATLPNPAKVAVVIALIFVALSLLTKVLHLVASLISVAIMALVLYGLYRIFLRPDSSNLRP